MGADAAVDDSPAMEPAALDRLGDAAGERSVAAQRAASPTAPDARANTHATAARTPRTRRAYATDWAHFTGWCATAGLDALPAGADTVRRYLGDMATTRAPDGSAVFSPATMARRLAAIAAAHRDAGHPPPTQDPAVGAVLTEIKRTRAHTTHQMRPLPLDDIGTMLSTMEYGTWPGGLTAARDAVVLLAGFAGALHRSELAALTIGDLTFHPADGLHLRIRSSKTDQDTRDATIVLPYDQYAGTCPPCAVLRWLRLLEAAPRGRTTLMRAVLATPPWTEQDHLYPHPASTAPGTAVNRSSTEGNANSPPPRPALPDHAPLLRAIRRGGTLTDTAITGNALHAMVRRRARSASLPGQVGAHSLRAGFVTTARRADSDHRAGRRQARHSNTAPVETYDRTHAPPAGQYCDSAGMMNSDTPTSTPAAVTPAVALRDAAGPSYAGEWSLFCDYTTATSQPALPTTVDALTGFFTALPARPSTLARRVRAITAAHRRAGHLFSRPDSGPAALAPPRTPQQRWAEACSLIAACPTRGWPHGLHGRRDAFLIVATVGLGLSHRATRALLPDAITATSAGDENPEDRVHLLDQDVPTDPDPRACPACTVVRWLNTLGVLDGLGRGSARMDLTAAHAPTHDSDHQHHPSAPHRWRHAATLLPAIDQHGWHDDYRAITTRTIRTRLACADHRASTHGAADTPSPEARRAQHPVTSETTRPPAPQSLDEVLTLLDGVADDADTLNARITALLDGHI